MRLKLTAYYLALLTAVLIFFGVAIYAYITRSLVNIIDTSLLATAQSIEVRLQSGELPDSHLDPEKEEQMLIAPLLLQIINHDGQLVEEQVLLKVHHLDVDVAALQSISDNEIHYSTVKLATDESLRIAIKRTVDQAGHPHFIRVGQSLDPLQKARRQLIILLSIAGPGALLLGSYGGLLLANQALGPVDRLTRAAEEIEAGDLSKRVQVPATKDELGRLALTFNRMIARLQSAFERQRQFTADASHELRTPLAVMRGDIEIALRRERTVTQYQDVLTSNLEEIIRLSRLVEELLMLARADVEQTQFQREPVQLNELCAQVIDYLMPLAEVKEQRLLYKTTEHSPVTISGDAQRLKQMFLNLLDNAIKYTPAHGTITLELTTAQHHAVVTITDTGRGIPAQDLPYIFERFFRHSRTTSDKSAAGFGLGLSIVKWIVDSHGGTIAATSNEGEGTVFTVRFPLCAPA